MKATQSVFRWQLLLALSLIALGGGAWQGWRWWKAAIAPVALESPTATPVAAEAGTTQVNIPLGSTAAQIGDTLKAAGLIRSTVAWDAWTRWQTLQSREGGFQAGTYALSDTSTLPQIANQIWAGEVVLESFTIPEGWSLKQMADYFQERGFFSADAFLAASQNVPRDRHPWLPDNLPQVEGFLFPDTYKLAANITPEAVIDQMLNRFQQVALPLYQQRQNQQRQNQQSQNQQSQNQQSQPKSPYSLLEWVTLASIVEKEAVVQLERPTIAGVFAKRLREGIPLGADPTVEYALGIRQTVDRPLTYAQVKVESPYNTYVYPGLPPTPIAAPGLASLEASLVPVDTPYLFFMARYDGTHIFSRTLAEHEGAKIAVDKDLSSKNQSPGTASN